MENVKKYPDKVKVLTTGNVLRSELIDAFVAGALARWRTELVTRIIPENTELVRSCQCLHDADTESDYDLYMWNKVQQLRLELAKDTIDKKCMFTRIKAAVAAADYSTASELQIEMAKKVTELRKIYFEYKSNMIHNI